MNYRTITMPPITDPRRGLTSTLAFCYLCGKMLRAKTVFQIHVVDGGGRLLHPDDEDLYLACGPDVLAGDLGGWQIGPDCAKKLPLEYRQKFQIEQPKGALMRTWKVFDFQKSQFVGSVTLAENPHAGDTVTLDGQRYRVTQAEDSIEHGQQIGCVTITDNNKED